MRDNLEHTADVLYTQMVEAGRNGWEDQRWLSHFRVLGQMADVILIAEEFASLPKSTLKAIADLRERLDFAESDVLDIDSAIEFLTHPLEHLNLHGKLAIYKGKKRIQRRMFPEGLSYERTGFGTPLTRSIYTLLASDSTDESRLVAPQGFEPRLIGSEPTVLPLNEGATD